MQQTHCGNFITSQLIIKISRSVMRRIFLTKNQIVNQVNIFFITSVVRYVDFAGVFELYQQLVNATFCPSFVCCCYSYYVFYPS